MKVNRKELRDILVALRPGLAKKEFEPQVTHFLFFEGVIATYNDYICIMHPFESDIQFSVKGEEFYRLIDDMSDEEVIITLVSGKLKIKAMSTSSTLATVPNEDTKLLSAIKILQSKMEKWKDIPKDFAEGLSLCAFSASPDLSQKVRACVCVDNETCSSLDVARASIFTMESSIKDKFFIVAKDATELSKFPVVEYCRDEKWAHFRTEDNVTFSCKLWDGEWPKNFFSLFDSMSEIEHFELPKELKTIVDSVFILASDLIDKTGKFLEITFEDGEIFVKANNDLGEVEKNLRSKYKGETSVILINVKFISQILNKATKFAYHKEKNLLHFASGSFQHILAGVSSSKNKEKP
jgi:DNA polymerase III sliding clamp (beta) subunit (PCNA family)